MTESIRTGHHSSLQSGSRSVSNNLQYYAVQGQSALDQLGTEQMKEELSLFYRIEYKLKERLFKINHLLLTHQAVSAIIYQFILLFKFLQVLFFILYKVEFVNEFSDKTLVKENLNSNSTTNTQVVSSHWEYSTFKLDDYLVYVSFHAYVLQLQSANAFLLMYIMMLAAFYVFLFQLVLFSERIFNSQRQQDMKEAMKFLIKITTLIMAFFLYALQIPMFTILFQGYKCNEDTTVEYSVSNIQCFSNTHILMIIFSTVTLIIYMAFLLTQFMLYTSNSFDSTLPWASLERQYSFIKIFIKLILCAGFVFDKQAVFAAEVELACSFMSLVMNYKHFNKALIFKKSVFYSQIIFEIMILWICISISVHRFSNQQINVVGLCLIFISGLLLSLVFLNLHNRKRENHLLRNSNLFLTPTDYELYFFWFFELIARYNQSDRVLIYGILYSHMMNCQNEKCKCITISNQLESESYIFVDAGHDLSQSEQYPSPMKNYGGTIEQSVEKPIVPHNLQSWKKGKHQAYNAMNIIYNDIEPSNQVKTQQRIEKQWFLYLSIIIQEAIDKFPKNVELKIINSFIQKAKINNEFKAIFELMNCELCEPSFQDQFTIFRRKIKIEEQLQLNHQKNTQEIGKIDVLQVYQYEQLFEKYQKLEFMTANSALNFWKELLNKSIDPNELQKRGGEISKNYEKIKDLTVRIQSIYPNEIKFFFKYGTFLKEIINNSYDALLYLEKAYNIYHSRLSKKSSGINEQNSFGENSGAAIIIIEATSKTIGTIIHSNEEIENVLGYKRKDIIGKNISNVMPRSIGKVHDKFIERYFETAKPTVIDIKRQLFASTKDGYLQPVLLLVKVYPQLMERLIFVGFIQALDKFSDMESPKQEYEQFEQHYMITDLEGNIFNVTPGLNQDLGLNSKFFSYSDSIFQVFFNIQKLCPEILEEDIQETLEQEGTTLVIDNTTMLNFIELEKLNSEEILEVRTKLGKYLVYVQMKKLTLDVNFCNIKLYRLVILGKSHDKNIQEFISKFTSRFENEDPEGKRNSLMMSDITSDINSMTGANNFSISSMSSNSSGSLYFNKILQDFKKALGERKVPRNLVILDRLVCMILLMIITLSSIEFGLKQNKLLEMGAQIESLIKVEMMANELIELNSYVRSAIDIANNLEFRMYENANFTRFEYLTSLIQYKTNNLISLHQEITQYEFSLGDNNLRSQSRKQELVLYRLDDMGSISNFSQPFDVAVNLYVDYALSLNQSNAQMNQLYLPYNLLEGRNVSSSKRNLKDSSNTTTKNQTNTTNISQNISNQSNSIETQNILYFLLANGPRSIREETIAIVQLYFGLSDNSLSSMTLQFLIIMILGVFITIFSILFVLYQLWVIESNKVNILSLYALLSMNDIKKVYDKSERYLEALKGNDEGMYHNLFTEKQAQEKNSDCRSPSSNKEFTENQVFKHDRFESEISEEEKDEALYKKYLMLRKQKHFISKGNDQKVSSKQPQNGDKYHKLMKKAILSMKQIQNFEIDRVNNSKKRIYDRQMKKLNSTPKKKEQEIGKGRKTSTVVVQQQFEEYFSEDDQQSESISKSELNHNAIFLEDKKVEDMKEELTEFEKQERKKQFYSSVNNKNIRSFILLILLGILFASYFIQQYIYPLYIVEQLEKATDYMEALTERYAYLSQSYFFLRERIINQDQLLFGTPDIDYHYNNLSLDAETDLIQMEISYPNLLQSIFDHLDLLDSSDFCNTIQSTVDFNNNYLSKSPEPIISNNNKQDLLEAIAKSNLNNPSSYTWMSQNQQIISQCANLSNGILNQGLEYQIGVFHKQFTDIYLQVTSSAPSTSFLSYLNPTSTSQPQAQNIFEIFFTVQEHFIHQISTSIKIKLQILFTDFFKKFRVILQVIYAVLITFGFLLLLIMRGRLIKKMIEDIVQSRGILNLIPEEFFEKNRENVESLIKKLKD